MKKLLSRKEFLENTVKYSVGAAVGVIGVDALSGVKLTARTKTTPWPWPYHSLDPEDLRIRAHTLYWRDKDCCAGVFGAFTSALAELIQDPWEGLPMEVMLYGRGGVNGWGSLCGTVNGAAAIISLVTTKADSGKLINEIYGWASSENLPSDAANQAAIDGKYIEKKYEGVLPQSISGSVICHASVTQWCVTAKKKVTDIERKERCARLAGDVAAKTAQILNAHFAQQFTPTYVTNPNVVQCQTCHGSTALNNVMTQMDCQQCHGDPHKTSGIVQTGFTIPAGFALEQNHPNPFGSSTTITFALPKREKVALSIHDIAGNEITRLLMFEDLQPGHYSVEWNGRDATGSSVPSGIYFARMVAGGFMKTVKMNITK